MGRAVLRLLSIAALVAAAIMCVGYAERGTGPDRPASRPADILQEIASEPPSLSAPEKGWTHGAVRRLRRLEAQVGAVEAMARAGEVALSAPSSGCRFAEATGDRTAAEIAPARIAMSRAFAVLSAAAAARAKQLAAQDAALEWVGWRGSRWVEWTQLSVFSEEVAAAKTHTDLAFNQLHDLIAAIRRAHAACK